jgi:hypothetical protein
VKLAIGENSTEAIIATAVFFLIFRIGHVVDEEVGFVDEERLDFFREVIRTIAVLLGSEVEIVERRNNASLGQATDEGEAGRDWIVLWDEGEE